MFRVAILASKAANGSRGRGKSREVEMGSRMNFMFFRLEERRTVGIRLSSPPQEKHRNFDAIGIKIAVLLFLLHKKTTPAGKPTRDPLTVYIFRCRIPSASQKVDYGGTMACFAAPRCAAG